MTGEEPVVSIGGVTHPAGASLTEMMERDEVLKYLVFHPKALIQFQKARAVIEELKLPYTEKEIALAVIKRQEQMRKKP